jgi:hypothetical protein
MSEVEASAAVFEPFAQAYLDWFDGAAARQQRAGDIWELHAILGRLQVAAAQLPAKIDLPDEPSPVVESSGNRGLSARAAAFVPFHAYSVVFDPFVLDEPPVTALLEDDLGDIYCDLRDGLEMFRHKRFSEALWTWRFGYYNHWGRHAAHAQTAIWEYLSSGNVR